MIVPYNGKNFEESLKNNQYTMIILSYPNNIRDIFTDWLCMVEKPESKDFDFWKNNGVDFNEYYDNLNDVTPLQYACSCGNIFNITEMMKYGTNDIETCKEYFELSCLFTGRNYNDYSYIFN